MGAKHHVSVDFIGVNGVSSNDRGKEIEIGDGGENTRFAPYELLLSALSGCLYMTFISILEKMQINVEKTNFNIHSEKSDEKVALLKTVNVDVTITNPEDEAKARKAVEIATRYCSVYQTLSKVAEMTCTVSII